MIVRAHEVEQRIVQPRFLQIEEDRVNAIERPQATFGKAARRFSGRFEWIRVSKLVLFFAPALEDAEQVARLAEGKTRQRINERQNAVCLRHLRRHRNRTFQAQRHAVQSVSLAEAIILGRIRAIVVQRRAPEHRTVAHHAVADVAHNLAVTKPARLVRHAQVAGVHELDELGGLVIEQHGRIIWVGGALPENGIARFDVRLALRETGRGVAAVTIRAAEDHVRRRVHRLAARVTFETAPALAVGVRLGLVNPVSFRQGVSGIARQLFRNGYFRAGGQVLS